MYWLYSIVGRLGGRDEVIGKALSFRHAEWLAGNAKRFGYNRVRIVESPATVTFR